MFYGMMAWSIWHKNGERLSHLVSVLMVVLGLQCIKDIVFMSGETDMTDYVWMVMTSVDMVTVPLYAFVLIELCRPGSLKTGTMIFHEVPFVLCPALLIATRNDLFYYADVVWAGIYGFGYAIWALIAIPRYHRRLKERFSYEDNINLNWLRYILLLFFLILSLWIVDCVLINMITEAIYMGVTLGVWMLICYFIYRHESVIDELAEPAAQAEPDTSSDIGNATLRERILDLFENQQIYLNPQLKLSDVAAMINSNRTYVSRFFNNSHGKTFFEFVNEYRVQHARTLLQSGNDKLDIVAEKSGFSSRQSFHRVFTKLTGCSPGQYRSLAK